MQGYPIKYADVAQWQSISLVMRRLWVRFPPSAPRRSKLYIVCSDFFQKVRAHSFRCSSFSSRKRFAGLRLDGMRALEWCVFFANTRRIAASFVSLATSFLFPKTSSRAHAAAPRFQIEPAYAGLRFGGNGRFGERTSIGRSALISLLLLFKPQTLCWFAA